MGHPNRISNERIQRIESLEKKYGIEDINLYAYMPSPTELIVNGEIFGDSLKEEIRFLCSVYDEDGDIIAAGENNYYGSGIVTRYIKPAYFKGIWPFIISVNIPSGQKIGKIRVYPNA